jgi:ribosomal protein S27AE
MLATFSSRCPACGQYIPVGAPLVRGTVKGKGRWICGRCYE